MNFPREKAKWAKEQAFVLIPHRFYLAANPALLHSSFPEAEPVDFSATVVGASQTNQPEHIQIQHIFPKES